MDLIFNINGPNGAPAYEVRVAPAQLDAMLSNFVDLAVEMMNTRLTMLGEPSAGTPSKVKKLHKFLKEELPEQP